MLNKESIFLSIVTPTFNEADTIESCVHRVDQVMNKYDSTLNYEHIILDNASTDDTIEKVIKLKSKFPNLKVAVNERNIGPTRTIYRGLSLTRGLWVVPMLPADLQDPAEIIPLFIESISGESNVIFGVRKNRQEAIQMRFFRSLYYRLIRRFASSDIPMHVGEFCLINRSLVDSLVDIADENPYVRGLIAISAKSPKYVEYTWGKRLAGKSKATARGMAEIALSGLVSTSEVPARLALFSGFVLAVTSILLAIIQTFLVVVGARNAAPGIATIIVSIFFFGGVQLFFIGLIGEYVLSMHRQIKRRPAVKTRFLD